MATNPESAQITDAQAGESAHAALHCKFGLCVLRLQRYEHLAKAVLGGAVVETHGQTIARPNETRAGPIAKKTLGPVMEDLVKGVIKSDAAPDDPDDEIAGDLNLIKIRTRFTRVLPADAHEKFKHRTESFVDMRNELVHHFLQRFDLTSDGGYQAAMAHLDRCLQSVDAELLELEGLAKDMQQMISLQTQILSQMDIMEIFAREFPEGSPDDFGPEHELIRWLKQAECMAREDGWTSLAVAASYIHAQSPDLRLKDHKVAKWSKVLDRSRVFEKQVEFAEGTAIPTRWYRSPPVK